MRRSVSLVLCVAGVLVWLCGPCARAQTMRFGVDDDQSYAEFVDAISASEFVRYDYVNNPRPRVAGAVAALLEFATRNPLADEEQLGLFVQEFADALQMASPGDAELKRSANFLPAIRFSLPLTGVAGLAGLDTNVGEAAAACLGIGVPQPFDFNSLQARMVGFESARGRTFAHAAEWSNLLVTGFMGRDLSGAENGAIAGVLRNFLESEGYEPVPDGVGDERFAQVYEGLSHLPETYAAHLAAITVAPGQEVPPLWDDVLARFDDINASTDAQLAELADEAGEPTLLEGVELSTDPGILDQLAADLQGRRDRIAMPRTILAANALLMLQSEDPDVRSLAEGVQITTALVSDMHDTVGTIIAVAKIVGGVFAVRGGIAGIATGEGTAVGIFAILVGVTLIVEGGASLADARGEQTSLADMQIFAQIVEVRRDIEDMRVQMHERFDRIEGQLNFVFEGMAMGFNAIGEQLGDLQDSVDNIVRDVLINRAALERVEDALYGMAENLLYADLAETANTYLLYRGFNGVDLPYAGPQSFLDGANNFFTFTVDTAQNTSLAGPLVSTLSPASASELLGGASIGRNVNDLRVFPFNHLGLPRLSTNRIVAPAQWAQGAAAYSQFARENPWYFAYQHEQQILSGVPVTDRKIERIIREGQNLASAMAAGRNQALFDKLFDGYNGAVDDLQGAINAHALGPVGLSDGVTSVDPWGSTAQGVRALAPALSSILDYTSGNFLALTLPAATTDFWGLFNSDKPVTAAVLARATGVGGQPWGSIEWTSGASTLRFVYITPDGTIAFERVLGLSASWSPSSFQFVWNCPTSSFRDALLSSEILTGNSYSTCISPSMVTVLSDTIIDGTATWVEREKIEHSDTGMKPLRGQDGQVAVGLDTVVRGAPFMDGAGEREGAVYVFTRPGVGSWLEETRLTPSDGDEFDRFGWSVAISGDTVIVGSPEHNNRGAAYFYTRAGDTWTQQAKIFPVDSTGGDQFGYSVAIDGDTAIIGAPFYDHVGTPSVNAGAAYVFKRDGDAWTLQQRLLRPEGNQADARFGWSVAIQGDSAVVGAPAEHIGPVADRGAAYVFRREASTWSAQGPKLLASDGAANHSFGSSVAIDDGVILVGARSAADRGAAYFFGLDAEGATWSEISKVTAVGGQSGHQFGETVALDGGTALVGASGVSGAAGSFQGAAYRFPVGTAGAVTPFFPSDAAAHQDFGSSVAIHGDVYAVGSLVDADPNQGVNGDATAYIYTIGSFIDPYIHRRLLQVRRDLLEAVIDELSSPPGSNPLRDTAGALSDWTALIEAYTTFSLPFALESSNTLRAGFGGSPETSQLALRGEAILPVSEGLLAGLIEPRRIDSIMYERSAIAQSEVDDALAGALQGHPYLNWMLAEVRALRDHVFDLAVDDAFTIGRDETLIVGASDGLLKNDVGQACRVITVDSMFPLNPAYIAPQHGQVMVNPDGSFTYTPDPGFVGTDRFSYRIGTFVDGLGCQPGGVVSRGSLDQHVFSNPADVLIIVAGPECPSDVNGDGEVNASDLALLLGAWGSDDPAADSNGDGVVNAGDLARMLGAWGPCG